MQDDKEIIRRTLSGEKDAFEMIIRKYQSPVFNYIGRAVGDHQTALEFTQDIFVKTYASLASFDHQYKFKTWLFKIASNYLIDYWRKKKLLTVSIDQSLSPDDDRPRIQLSSPHRNAEEQLEMDELRKKIESALEKVPPELRELFIWRHINGLSYKEMAQIKNIPMGTVKNRVFQAKELIRSHLEDKL
ncbi:MAG: sigma-70 family RNA polymerase sigma factor [Candidatus Aminicenantes bacterium]